jgi:hypothetical protein
MSNKPFYVTRLKKCYCHTCKKSFHYLGINRHRAMHRDKYEDCKITYTHGDTYYHRFSDRLFVCPANSDACGVLKKQTGVD